MPVNAQIAKLIGPRIFAYRKQAGLTQEALGERVRKSAVYISMLERGLRCPSTDLIFRLAAAMGVDQGELIRREWSGVGANWPSSADTSRGRGPERS